MKIGLSPLINEQTTLLDYFSKQLNYSKNHVKKFAEKQAQQNLFPKKSFEVSANLINKNMISPVYEGPQITIIFEDENFLVLDKPCDIHSHPLSYEENNNCLSFLRSQCKFPALNIAKLDYDRGLIHRLDFKTSGVLILCKNEDLHSFLRKNFSKVAKEKIYYAAVKGNFTKIGNHQLFIEPTGSKGSRMKIVESSKSKNLGKLSVEKITYHSQKNISLLKINLETGIRHQIRVTLAYLGYPIIGDDLYQGESFTQLLLHSYQYSLVIDKLGEYCFKSTLPEFF